MREKERERKKGRRRDIEREGEIRETEGKKEIERGIKRDREGERGREREREGETGRDREREG